MEVGTIFYIAKDEWSSRGSDEKYYRYAVGGTTEDGKGWLCFSEKGDNGRVNKRSGRFCYEMSLPKGKTYEVIFQSAKDDMEYIGEHRSHIVEAVKYCNSDELRRIAKVIGYDGGDTDG